MKWKTGRPPVISNESVKPLISVRNRRLSLSLEIIMFFYFVVSSIICFVVYCCCCCWFTRPSRSVDRSGSLSLSLFTHFLFLLAIDPFKCQKSKSSLFSLTVLYHSTRYEVFWLCLLENNWNIDWVCFRVSTNKT